MRKVFTFCSALLLTALLATPAFADVWEPPEPQISTQPWIWIGALVLLAVIVVLLVIKYIRRK